MAGSGLRHVTAAIDYIESHLAELLTLDGVAGGVHCSKYHLHRTFSGLTGLTLHDYIQRRRLTESAKLLVFSAEPILELALLAGYESQQAFTDVFTAMYKRPPNCYREEERFYPLQLKFEFGGGEGMPKLPERGQWDITFATVDDIPCWMALVRLVIDGFPRLDEEGYVHILKSRMDTNQALILKAGETAIGIMLFSHDTGSIDFMGTHPLYRRQGIPRALLDKVMGELLREREISITTYRAGDRADTGHRKEIMALGFAEAELLVEFGYPTQRFVLPREDI